MTFQGLTGTGMVQVSSLPLACQTIALSGQKAYTLELGADVTEVHCDGTSTVANGATWLEVVREGGPGAKTTLRGWADQAKTVPVPLGAIPVDAQLLQLQSPATGLTAPHELVVTDAGGFCLGCSGSGGLKLPPARIAGSAVTLCADQIALDEDPSKTAWAAGKQPIGLPAVMTGWRGVYAESVVVALPSALAPTATIRVKHFGFNDSGLVGTLDLPSAVDVSLPALGLGLRLGDPSPAAGDATDVHMSFVNGSFAVWTAAPGDVVGAVRLPAPLFPFGGAATDPAWLPLRASELNKLAATAAGDWTVTGLTLPKVQLGTSGVTLEIPAVGGGVPGATVDYDGAQVSLTLPTVSVGLPAAFGSLASVTATNLTIDGSGVDGEVCATGLSSAAIAVGTLAAEVSELCVTLTDSVPTLKSFTGALVLPADRFGYACPGASGSLKATATFANGVATATLDTASLGSCGVVAFSADQSFTWDLSSQAVATRACDGTSGTAQTAGHVELSFTPATGALVLTGWQTSAKSTQAAIGQLKIAASLLQPASPQTGILMPTSLTLGPNGVCLGCGGAGGVDLPPMTVGASGVTVCAAGVVVDADGTQTAWPADAVPEGQQATAPTWDGLYAKTLVVTPPAGTAPSAPVTLRRVAMSLGALSAVVELPAPVTLSVPALAGFGVTLGAPEAGQATTLVTTFQSGVFKVWSKRSDGALGAVRLPTALLRPAADPNGQVVVPVSAPASAPLSVGEGGGFLLDDLTLPKATVGATGVAVAASGVAFDHDGAANPTGLTGQPTTWRGVFLKTASVDLPKTLGDQANVTATDLRIDASGVHGSVTLTGLTAAPMSLGGTTLEVSELTVQFASNLPTITKAKGTVDIPSALFTCPASGSDPAKPLRVDVVYDAAQGSEAVGTLALGALGQCGTIDVAGAATLRLGGGTAKTQACTPGAAAQSVDLADTLEVKVAASSGLITLTAKRGATPAPMGALSFGAGVLEPVTAGAAMLLPSQLTLTTGGSVALSGGSIDLPPSKIGGSDLTVCAGGVTLDLDANTAAWGSGAAPEGLADAGVATAAWNGVFVETATLGVPTTLTPSGAITLRRLAFGSAGLSATVELSSPVTFAVPALPGPPGGFALALGHPTAGTPTTVVARAVNGQLALYSTRTDGVIGALRLPKSLVTLSGNASADPWVTFAGTKDAPLGSTAAGDFLFEDLALPKLELASLAGLAVQATGVAIDVHRTRNGANVPAGVDATGGNGAKGSFRGVTMRSVSVDLPALFGGVANVAATDFVLDGSGVDGRVCASVSGGSYGSPPVNVSGNLCVKIVDNQPSLESADATLKLPASLFKCASNPNATLEIGVSADGSGGVSGVVELAALTGCTALDLGGAGTLDLGSQSVPVVACDGTAKGTAQTATHLYVAKAADGALTIRGQLGPGKPHPTSAPLGTLRVGQGLLTPATAQTAILLPHQLTISSTGAVTLGTTPLALPRMKVGGSEVTVCADAITLDLDPNTTPWPSAQTPPGLAGATGAWNGLYVPSLEVTLPNQTNPNAKLTVAQLALSSAGLSATLTMTPALELSFGTALGGFGATLGNPATNTSTVVASYAGGTFQLYSPDAGAVVGAITLPTGLFKPAGQPDGTPVRIPIAAQKVSPLSVGDAGQLLAEGLALVKSELRGTGVSVTAASGVTFDFDGTNNAAGTPSSLDGSGGAGSFRGVYAASLKVDLPQSLGGAANLTATGLSIGSAGVNGALCANGLTGVVKVGGTTVDVSELCVSFSDNVPTLTSAKGKVTLAGDLLSCSSGSLVVDVEYAQATGWAGVLELASPGLGGCATGTFAGGFTRAFGPKPVKTVDCAGTATGTVQTASHLRVAIASDGVVTVSGRTGDTAAAALAPLGTLALPAGVLAAVDSQTGILLPSRMTVSSSGVDLRDPQGQPFAFSLPPSKVGGTDVTICATGVSLDLETAQTVWPTGQAPEGLVAAGGADASWTGLYAHSVAVGLPTAWNASRQVIAKRVGVSATEVHATLELQPGLLVSLPQLSGFGVSVGHPGPSESTALVIRYAGGAFTAHSKRSDGVLAAIRLPTALFHAKGDPSAPADLLVTAPKAAPLTVTSGGDWLVDGLELPATELKGTGVVVTASGVAMDHHAAQNPTSLSAKPNSFRGLGIASAAVDLPKALGDAAGVSATGLTVDDKGLDGTVTITGLTSSRWTRGTVTVDLRELTVQVADNVPTVASAKGALNLPLATLPCANDATKTLSLDVTYSDTTKLATGVVDLSTLGGCKDLKLGDVATLSLGERSVTNPACGSAQATATTTARYLAVTADLSETASAGTVALRGQSTASTQGPARPLAALQLGGFLQPATPGSAVVLPAKLRLSPAGGLELLDASDQPASVDLPPIALGTSGATICGAGLTLDTDSTKTAWPAGKAPDALVGTPLDGPGWNGLYVQDLTLKLPANVTASALSLKRVGVSSTGVWATLETNPGVAVQVPGLQGFGLSIGHWGPGQATPIVVKADAGGFALWSKRSDGVLAALRLPGHLLRPEGGDPTTVQWLPITATKAEPLGSGLDGDWMVGGLTLPPTDLANTGVTLAATEVAIDFHGKANPTGVPATLDPGAAGSFEGVYLGKVSVDLPASLGDQAGLQATAFSIGSKGVNGRLCAQNLTSASLGDPPVSVSDLCVRIADNVPSLESVDASLTLPAKWFSCAQNPAAGGLTLGVSKAPNGDLAGTVAIAELGGCTDLQLGPVGTLSLGAATVTTAPCDGTVGATKQTATHLRIAKAAAGDTLTLEGRLGADPTAAKAPIGRVTFDAGLLAPVNPNAPVLLPESIEVKLDGKGFELTPSAFDLPPHRVAGTDITVCAEGVELDLDEQKVVWSDAGEQAPQALVDASKANPGWTGVYAKALTVTVPKALNPTANPTDLTIAATHVGIGSEGFQATLSLSTKLDVTLPALAGFGVVLGDPAGSARDVVVSVSAGQFTLYTPHASGVIGAVQLPTTLLTLDGTGAPAQIPIVAKKDSLFGADADGQFLVEGLTLPKVELGSSGVKLAASNVAIDLHGTKNAAASPMGTPASFKGLVLPSLNVDLPASLGSQAGLTASDFAVGSNGVNGTLCAKNLTTAKLVSGPTTVDLTELCVSVADNTPKLDSAKGKVRVGALPCGAGNGALEVAVDVQPPLASGVLELTALGDCSTVQVGTGLAVALGGQTLQKRDCDGTSTGTQAIAPYVRVDVNLANGDMELRGQTVPGHSTDPATLAPLGVLVPQGVLAPVYANTGIALPTGFAVRGGKLDLPTVTVDVPPMAVVGSGVTVCATGVTLDLEDDELAWPAGGQPEALTAAQLGTDPKAWNGLYVAQARVTLPPATGVTQSLALSKVGINGDGAWGTLSVSPALALTLPQLGDLGVTLGKAGASQQTDLVVAASATSGFTLYSKRADGVVGALNLPKALLHAPGVPGQAVASAALELKAPKGTPFVVTKAGDWLAGAGLTLPTTEVAGSGVTLAASTLTVDFHGTLNADPPGASKPTAFKGVGLKGLTLGLPKALGDTASVTSDELLVTASGVEGTVCMTGLQTAGILAGTTRLDVSELCLEFVNNVPTVKSAKASVALPTSVFGCSTGGALTVSLDYTPTQIDGVLALSGLGACGTVKLGGLGSLVLGGGSVKTRGCGASDPVQTVATASHLYVSVDPQTGAVSVRGQTSNAKVGATLAAIGAFQFDGAFVVSNHATETFAVLAPQSVAFSPTGSVTWPDEAIRIPPLKVAGTDVGFCADGVTLDTDSSKVPWPTGGAPEALVDQGGAVPAWNGFYAADVTVTLPSTVSATPVSAKRLAVNDSGVWLALELASPLALTAPGLSGFGVELGHPTAGEQTTLVASYVDGGAGGSAFTLYSKRADGRVGSLALPTALFRPKGQASGQARVAVLGPKSAPLGSDKAGNWTLAGLTLPDTDVWFGGSATGVAIEATGVAVDHHATLNPPGVPSKLAATWRGVYLKSLSVDLPPAFGDTANVAAADFVIGTGGASGSLCAKGLKTPVGQGAPGATISELCVSVTDNQPKLESIDATLTLPTAWFPCASNPNTSLTVTVSDDGAGGVQGAVAIAAIQGCTALSLGGLVTLDLTPATVTNPNCGTSGNAAPVQTATHVFVKRAANGDLTVRGQLNASTDGTSTAPLGRLSFAPGILAPRAAGSAILMPHTVAIPASGAPTFSPATVTVPPMAVAGTEVELCAAGVALDLDTTKSFWGSAPPVALAKAGAANASWRGLYVGALSVTLPASLSPSGSPLTVAAKRLGVSPDGVWGTLEVSPNLTLKLPSLPDFALALGDPRATSGTTQIVFGFGGASGQFQVWNPVGSGLLGGLKLPAAVAQPLSGQGDGWLTISAPEQAALGGDSLGNWIAANLSLPDPVQIAGVPGLTLKATGVTADLSAKTTPPSLPSTLDGGGPQGAFQGVFLKSVEVGLPEAWVKGGAKLTGSDVAVGSTGIHGEVCATSLGAAARIEVAGASLALSEACVAFAGTTAELKSASGTLTLPGDWFGCQGGQPLSASASYASGVIEAVVTVPTGGCTVGFKGVFEVELGGGALPAVSCAGQTTGAVQTATHLYVKADTSAGTVVVQGQQDASKASTNLAAIGKLKPLQSLLKPVNPAAGVALPSKVTISASGLTTDGAAVTLPPMTLFDTGVTVCAAGVTLDLDETSVPWGTDPAPAGLTLPSPAGAWKGLYAKGVAIGLPGSLTGGAPKTLTLADLAVGANGAGQAVAAATFSGLPLTELTLDALAGFGVALGDPAGGAPPTVHVVWDGSQFKLWRSAGSNTVAALMLPTTLFKATGGATKPFVGVQATANAPILATKDGDFLVGTASLAPVELGDTGVTVGATSVAVDYHGSLNPTPVSPPSGFSLPAGFRGVWMDGVSVKLPKAFGDLTVTASNFSIGEAGTNGTVTVQQPTPLALGDVQFQVNNLSVAIVDNVPSVNAVTGTATLPAKWFGCSGQGATSGQALTMTASYDAQSGLVQGYVDTTTLPAACKTLQFGDDTTFGLQLGGKAVQQGCTGAPIQVDLADIVYVRYGVADRTFAVVGRQGFGTGGIPSTPSLPAASDQRPIAALALPASVLAKGAGGGDVLLPKNVTIGPSGVCIGCGGSGGLSVPPMTVAGGAVSVCGTDLVLDLDATKTAWSAAGAPYGHAANEPTWNGFYAGELAVTIANPKNPANPLLTAKAARTAISAGGFVTELSASSAGKLPSVAGADVHLGDPSVPVATRTPAVVRYANGTFQMFSKGPGTVAAALDLPATLLRQKGTTDPARILLNATEAAPLEATSAGDFYLAGLSLPAAEVGASGVVVTVTDLTVDAHSQLSPPPKASEPAWTGVHLASVTVDLPESMGGVSNVTGTDLLFGGDGVSGKIEAKLSGATLEAGGVGASLTDVCVAFTQNVPSLCGLGGGLELPAEWFGCADEPGKKLPIALSYDAGTYRGTLDLDGLADCKALDFGGTTLALGQGTHAVAGCGGSTSSVTTARYLRVSVTPSPFELVVQGFSTAPPATGPATGTAPIGVLSFPPDQLRPTTAAKHAVLPASLTIGSDGVCLGCAVASSSDASVTPTAPAGLSLPPMDVAGTGVVVCADQLALDLHKTKTAWPTTGQGLDPTLQKVDTSGAWMGLYAKQLSVELPLTEKATGQKVKLSAADMAIGTSGVTGVFSGSFTQKLAFEGFEVSNVTASMTFVNNVPTAFGISADFVLPFFDEKLALAFALDGQGGWLVSVGGASSQAGGGQLLKFTKSFGAFTLRASLGKLQFGQADGQFYVETDATIGLKTPVFDTGDVSLEGLRITSLGEVLVDGGWYTLPEPKRLTLAGFSFELSRLGFGTRDDGRRWLALGGGFQLQDVLPVGVKVQDLVVSWKPTNAQGEPAFADVALEVSAIELEMEVPGVLKLSGALRWCDSNTKSCKAGAANAKVAGKWFEGAVQVELSAPPMTVGGRVVVGTGKEAGSGDAFTFWYVQIDAQLPAGLPIPASPIAVYGVSGAFGKNVGIQLRTKTPRGIDPTNPVTIARGSFTFMAGVTLGTVFDNGFTFNTDVRLFLEVPGPVVAFNGQAWIATARTGRKQPALLTVDILFDGKRQEFVFSMRAKYKVDEKDGKIVDIGGFAEVLANKDTWHVYVGTKSEPIFAKILGLIDANVYVMVGDRVPFETGEKAGFLVGANIYLGAKGSALGGLVGFAYGLYAGGEMGFQMEPKLVEAALKLGGEFKIWLGPFKLGLELEAGLKGTADKPYRLEAVLRAKLILPWPLPSPELKLPLVWQDNPPLYPTFPPTLERVVFESEVTGRTVPAFDVTAGPAAGQTLTVADVPFDTIAKATFTRVVNPQGAGSSAQPDPTVTFPKGVVLYDTVGNCKIERVLTGWSVADKAGTQAVEVRGGWGADVGTKRPPLKNDAAPATKSSKWADQARFQSFSLRPTHADFSQQCPAGTANHTTPDTCKPVPDVPAICRVLAPIDTCADPVSGALTGALSDDPKTQSLAVARGALSSTGPCAGGGGTLDGGGCVFGAAGTCCQEGDDCATLPPCPAPGDTPACCCTRSLHPIACDFGDRGVLVLRGVYADDANQLVEVDGAGATTTIGTCAPLGAFQLGHCPSADPSLCAGLPASPAVHCTRTDGRSVAPPPEQIGQTLDCTSTPDKSTVDKQAAPFCLDKTYQMTISARTTVSSLGKVKPGQTACVLPPTNPADETLTLDYTIESAPDALGPYVAWTAPAASSRPVYRADDVVVQFATAALCEVYGCCSGQGLLELTVRDSAAKSAAELVPGAVKRFGCSAGLDDGTLTANPLGQDATGDFMVFDPAAPLAADTRYFAQIPNPAGGQPLWEGSFTTSRFATFTDALADAKAYVSGTRIFVQTAEALDWRHVTATLGGTRIDRRRVSGDRDTVHVFELAAGDPAASVGGSVVLSYGSRPHGVCGCATDADCPGGGRCTDRACVGGWTCDAAADCGSAFACDRAGPTVRRGGAPVGETVTLTLANGG